MADVIIAPSSSSTLLARRFCAVVAVGCAALLTPAAPAGYQAAAGLDVTDLPRLREGVQTHQFSAYDRAGDNYDAQYFPLYTEKDGECVVFDAFGPGCLYRQQMNLWGKGSEPERQGFRRVAGEPWPV